MRPKDLKLPFADRESCPLLAERVFYLPSYYPGYETFPFPSWEGLFGNDYDVHIEYGSGNGDWIVEKARVHPHANWVAIEFAFDRVRKIFAKRHNLALQNLFIVCGEAWNFTRAFVRESSVAHAYINFPDPWPKRRHTKNRLVSPAFVTELVRILKPGGRVTLATDDAPYRDFALPHLRHALQPVDPEPFFRREYPGYGTSYFEEMWRGQGKEIYYTELCK